jgi:hypothetical protein
MRLFDFEGVPAGETSAISLRSRTLSHSRRKRDFIDMSIELNDKSALDAEALGFIPSLFCFLSLPHSEVPASEKIQNGDTEIQPVSFIRKNGDRKIILWNHGDVGLPCGKLPRVIIAWLATEAKKTKSRELTLGKSFKEFAAKLELQNSGGKKGDLLRLKKQASRVFTFRISVLEKNKPRSSTSFENLQIVDQGALPWDLSWVTDDSSVERNWEGKILLSEKFFEVCLKSGVPVDFRILHILRSPLSIDIYLWLTYRVNSISRRTPIPWTSLRWQFGAAYGDESGLDDQGLRDFKKNFIIHLNKVRFLWEGLNIEPTTAALVLLPSSPNIPSSLS